MGTNLIAKQLHQNKYRPDIDGIRAIAVILVIICHGFPNLLPGGIVGVDIFFVISGYLITSILLKDLSNNKFSITEFYRRRIIRIFPALLIVFMFSIILGWYSLTNVEFIALGKNITASTFFSENFYLWRQSSYFDISSDKKPMLHLWSLAIEEQFYIFWPLILFFSNKFKLNLLFFIIIITLVSIGINTYDVQFDLTAAYYSPLGRAWELLIGSLLAYLKINNVKFLDSKNNLKSLLGIIFIVLGFIFSKPNNFPGLIALLPTIGAFLLISSDNNAWVNKHILSSTPMIWIGLISYPLYLWHWPLMSFTYIIFGSLSIKASLVCIVVSILGAYLTFIIIEKPIRTSRNKPVISLIVVMLAIILVSILISANFIKARLNNIKVPERHEWSFLQSVTPNFSSIKNSTYMYELYPERKKQTLFIGDSHIAQYAEKINQIIADNPEKGGVTLGIGGSCIPVQGVVSKDQVRLPCLTMIKKAYELSKDSRFETIVIGGAWSFYFTTNRFTYNNKELNTLEAQNEILSTLATNIKELEDRGKKVIFILDNPFSSKLNMIGWRNRLFLNVDDITPNLTTTVDLNNVKINNQLLDWTNNNHIRYINPYKKLCNKNICKVSEFDSILVYKDSSHLNPDWVLSNANYIDDIFK